MADAIARGRNGGVSLPTANETLIWIKATLAACCIASPTQRDQQEAAMAQTDEIRESMLKAMAPAVDKQWKASGEAMETFWKTQDHALDAMESFFQNWFKRRHAGARQAIRVVRDISECRDPMEAATCMQEWMQESMRRAREDFQEASESLQKLIAESSAQPAPKAKPPARH
jgi:Phasin protein